MTEGPGISTDPSGERDGASGSESSGPSALPRLVDRLRNMADQDDGITLDRLTTEIGAKGHAQLLLAVAILMVLPTGMIPGMGGALGALLAIIGVQMLRGHQGVWLPQFIGRREISAERLRSLASGVRPTADWVQRRLRPRWEMLSGGGASISIIALILILCGSSLLVLGAIPIAAPLIGVPVAVFGLGILARDGAVVAFGYAFMAAVWGDL